jgi:hypothetical protein
LDVLREMGLLREILNYILNVLDIAWTSFAHAMQVEVAAIMISPGLISIVSILVVGYAYLLVRQE